MTRLTSIEHATPLEGVGLEPHRGFLVDQFRLALRDGEVGLACAVGDLVRMLSGLQAVHALIADCLEKAVTGWAEGQGAVLDEHRTTRAALKVLQSLPVQRRHGPAGKRVVLASPSGDRHHASLVTLAQRLSKAGHQPMVVDDVPTPELLAFAESSEAVVLSAHLAWRPATALRLVTALREVNHDLLVVVGGPGAPSGPAFRRHCHADLLTVDPDALLRVLAESGSPQRDLVCEGPEGVAHALCRGPVR